MQTAALRYNQSRKVFELTKPVWIQKVGDDARVIQKNWVPFLYRSDVYFVYNIHPLVVIRFPGGSSAVYDGSFTGDDVPLETISEERCHPAYKTHWSYGHLRGGTPAVLVGDEYLAFFHSKSTPLYLDDFGGWSLLSYWFGAYTFTAEPPFVVTKMSKVPIVKNEWYDGAWFNKGNGYIIYPAGFVIQQFNNISYVMLSFSLQDKQGYLAKIPLQELYDSMISVNCSAIAEDEPDSNELLPFVTKTNSTIASSFLSNFTTPNLNYSIYPNSNFSIFLNSSRPGPPKLNNNRRRRLH